MTLSTMSTEPLILLQLNLSTWYIIISWSVLCKYYIAVMEVKVTVKIQNFIESLSNLYFYTTDSLQPN